MIVAEIVGAFLVYNLIGSYTAGRVRSADREAGYDANASPMYALPWAFWPLVIVGVVAYRVCYRAFKRPFELGDTYHKRKLER